MEAVSSAIKANISWNDIICRERIEGVKPAGGGRRRDDGGVPGPAVPGGRVLRAARGPRVELTCKIIDFM